MTASSPSATPPLAGDELEPLLLRSSPELTLLPPHVGSTPSVRGGVPVVAVQPEAQDTFAEHFERALTESPAWVLIGLAAVATAGWMVERRRRRELETDKDSVLWAGVQPAVSSIITAVDEEFFDEEAPVASPAAGGAPPDTTTVTSRREATLIDLHQLDGRLRRRRAQGDLLAATLLLQQHLSDFRFTSPWVFLELRQLHHLLRREQEWELAREAFRARFAQRAPLWQAPPTDHVQLCDDPLICAELLAHWPFRESRMIIRRWVLGEPDVQGQQHPAPILALGVYRDLLFLDRLLDRVMESHPEPADSLL